MKLKSKMLMILSFAVSVTLGCSSQGPQVVCHGPLSHPIAVTNVSLGSVVLTGGRVCRLAGVSFEGCEREWERLFQAGQSDYSNYVFQATGLLTVATSQGVEIVAQWGDKYLLGCRPRLWGGPKGRVVFQRYFVNEIVLASGLAVYDENTSGLSENVRLRLRAAELMAKTRGNGIWGTSSRAEARFMEFRLGSVMGLYYDRGLLYRRTIEGYMGDLLR
jgi:hypothetical protein